MHGEPPERQSNRKPGDLVGSTGGPLEETREGGKKFLGAQEPLRGPSVLLEPQADLALPFLVGDILLQLQQQLNKDPLDSEDMLAQNNLR